MKKSRAIRAQGTSQDRAKSQYQHGAHTTHRLRYHLVWTPKYRRRLLEGEIAVRLRQLLEEGCGVNDWLVHELSIAPDHIHLLIQLPPHQSVARAVQILKGGSSKVIRAEQPALDEWLWGKHFWSEGYFAESVGRLEEGVIRRYISQQREPNS